jgi:hypothetical protein
MALLASMRARDAGQIDPNSGRAIALLTPRSNHSRMAPSNCSRRARRSSAWNEDWIAGVLRPAGANR